MVSGQRGHKFATVVSIISPLFTLESVLKSEWGALANVRAVRFSHKKIFSAIIFHQTLII